MKRKWTDKEKQYIADWSTENTIQVKMKLNKINDADIINKLNEVDNKQGYIKSLIRKDIGD